MGFRGHVRFLLLGGGLGLLASASPARGQDELPSDDADAAWRFSLTPYVWLPAMSGEIGVGGRFAEPDQSFGDAIDLVSEHFNFALMLHAEWQNERLSVFADGLYMDLEDERATRAGELSAGLTQGIFELGTGFAILHRSLGGSGWPHIHLEPIAGARVQYLDVELRGPPGEVGADESQAWADGFGGVRARLRLNGAAALFGRIDLGAGGSDLTWNAVAGADVGLAPGVLLTGGYRWLDTDYSDGSFVYDVLLQGPFLGVSIRF